MLIAPFHLRDLLSLILADAEMGLAMLTKRWTIGSKQNPSWKRCYRPRRIARSVCFTGFSLIELLVVMGIIGVLVTMLLPAVQSSREASRRIVCSVHLRQLGIAIMNYEGSHRRLPKGDWRVRTIDTGVDSLGTWVSLTLPYLEEAALYSAIDFSKAYFEQDQVGASQKPHHITFEAHICPTNGDVGLSMWNNAHYGARGNYAANSGWAGAESGLWLNDIKWLQVGANWRGHPENQSGLLYTAPNGRRVRSALSGFGPFLINKGIALREATDGLSRTVALSEIRTIAGDDVRGSLHFGGGVLYLHSETPNTEIQDIIRLCVPTIDAPCASTDATWRGFHKLSARSAHPAGLNSMMLDGSVHFLNDRVDREVWKAVSTFCGEEQTELLR
jgi:prepilin-type N-terminal cleavage/methylation domain-containing protein